MNELPVLPEYQNVVVKPRARDYLVDGVRFQRVTTALGIINKPALIPWAKRVALAKVRDVLHDDAVMNELAYVGEMVPDEFDAFVDRLLERASAAPDEARDERAGVGTQAHKAIQDILTVDPSGWGKFVSLIDDALLPTVEAAVAFLDDLEIVVCDTERVVWSPTEKIAGTVDGVGFRGDSLVIWDWKTGAHIYWETALQLGAYAHLLEHLTGVAVVEAYAVRLPRPGDDGGYEARRLTGGELQRAWSVYRASHELYEASKHEWWEKPNV